MLTAERGGKRSERFIDLSDKHPLYALDGTANVLALAVARRQHEIIGYSLYTSAR